MPIEINELTLDKKGESRNYTPQIFLSSYYFYFLSFLGSIVLMILQPSQAKSVENAYGWYAQPYIGPFLGLSIIALFSGCYVLVKTIKNFDTIKDINPVELSYQLISKYRIAIIVSVFFSIYIFSLTVIGFALSSLIFVLTMLWISELFNRFWVAISFLSIVIITLVFRVAIGLWLPDVWFFSLFPNQIADFSNMYL